MYTLYVYIRYKCSTTLSSLCSHTMEHEECCSLNWGTKECIVSKLGASTRFTKDQPQPRWLCVWSRSSNFFRTLEPQSLGRLELKKIPSGLNLILVKDQRSASVEQALVKLNSSEPLWFPFSWDVASLACHISHYVFSIWTLLLCFYSKVWKTHRVIG